MSRLEEMERGLGSNVVESMGVDRPKPVYGTPAPQAGGLAVSLQGIKKSPDAARIPVGKIMPDPDQPREEFDEDALDNLAENMKSKGQLQPIRVRWDDKHETYVIICGERRWRAAVKAELEFLDCMIQKTALTPAELLGLQMVENLQREDLRPIEQAKAFRTLMTLNEWSVRELARQLDIDHTKIVRAMALLELPESVQAHVEQGTMSPTVAYEVSKAGDVESIQAVAADVTTGNLNRAQTVERVQREIKAREPKGKGRGVKAKPKAIKERTVRVSVGKVDVTLRKAGDPAAILEALREAVQVLEGEVETEEPDAG